MGRRVVFNISCHGHGHGGWFSVTVGYTHQCDCLADVNRVDVEIYVSSFHNILTIYLKCSEACRSILSNRDDLF